MVDKSEIKPISSQGQCPNKTTLAVTFDKNPCGGLNAVDLDSDKYNEGNIENWRCQKVILATKGKATSGADFRLKLSKDFG